MEVNNILPSSFGDMGSIKMYIPSFVSLGYVMKFIYCFSLIFIAWIKLNMYTTIALKPTQLLNENLVKI